VRKSEWRGWREVDSRRVQLKWARFVHAFVHSQGGGGMCAPGTNRASGLSFLWQVRKSEWRGWREVDLRRVQSKWAGFVHTFVHSQGGGGMCASGINQAGGVGFGWLSRE